MKREKKQQVQNTKTKKNGFSLKTYLREFLVFISKNLIKPTGVLFVVAVILIALGIKPVIDVTMAQDCAGSCVDEMALFFEYSSRLQVLLVIAFAGIVPYMYAPVFGFVVSIIAEVSVFAYVIKGYGYMKGIAFGIIPLILNVIIVCIITALGIYICKSVTTGYRLSNAKSMNAMNFKIKIYESLNKEEKVKELTKKRDAKINKLKQQKEKINYLQILNTSIVVCIIQFISVIIQDMML